jgi:hypothetical protein
MIFSCLTIENDWLEWFGTGPAGHGRVEHRFRPELPSPSVGLDGPRPAPPGRPLHDSAKESRRGFSRPLLLSRGVHQVSFCLVFGFPFCVLCLVQGGIDGWINYLLTRSNNKSRPDNTDNNVYEMWIHATRLRDPGRVQPVIKSRDPPLSKVTLRTRKRLCRGSTTFLFYFWLFVLIGRTRDHPRDRIISIMTSATK